MEWQTIIQTYYQRLLSLFRQCHLCGNAVNNSPFLCSACQQDLPLFKQTMIHNDLLNWPAINKALPHINFDKLFCLAPYSAPFNHWLTAFKYGGRFELASIFTDLLATQWQLSQQQSTSNWPSVDLVVSVPLHAQKWQTRGYNQAHLIAQRFAKKTYLPYQASIIKRVKKNNSQVGQTGAQRRQNLKNTFALTQDLATQIKHVMLIDDVVTTGSTVSEISLLLKQAGAETVTVVAVCLTLPKS